MTRVFGCSLFSPLFLPFFFRNILEHCVFKTTLCIIFLSLFLLKSIFFYYILKEEKQRVFGGTLNQAETCLLSSHWAALRWESLQPWSRSTLATFHKVFVERDSWERERFIPSHNNAKNVLKIIVHCRSNMIITDILPGAPWILSSCFFSSYSFLWAAHPDYTSVWEQ